MSDQPLPLSGLRVVDCTVDRGELASRLLGDLGADVVKVEPPGGSPARRTAPVRRGVSLAFAVRNAGKRGVVLDLADARADVERFHELLDHADVLVTSAAELAPGLDARDLATRHPHLVVGALTPFGLDGPYADWAATDATLAASGGFAFKAGVPEDSPLLPPGHLVDDAASITGAFGLLCALYQREATGAGQFVEVSVNEAIAQICDWSLPNAMARIEAGFPAGEVRNGNGPIYPIFACKGGYVRLIILSVRQWHAMREWLGEPEFLQDPALDGFVARREIAEHVLNPLFVSHFADLSMEEVSLEAQKRGIVCTPALTPADILTNEHFAVAAHVRRRRGGTGRHRAPRVRVLRDRRRARRPDDAAPGGGRAHRRGVRVAGRRPPRAHGGRPRQPAARRPAGDGLRARRGRRGGGPPLRRVRRRGHEDRVAHLHRLHAPAARRRDEPVVRVVEPVEARVRRERQDRRRARPHPPAGGAVRSRRREQLDRHDGQARHRVRRAPGGEPGARDGVEPADGVPRRLVVVAGLRPEHATARWSRAPLELRRPRRARGLDVDLSRPRRRLPRRGGVAGRARRPRRAT